MELSFCAIRCKNVINVVDGKDLGHVQDITFTECGKINGIIVPGSSTAFLGFLKGDSIYIPWKNVCKIGDDVLLVELINAQNKSSISENSD